VRAELLAAEEALRDARTDVQRSQEELARARDDLASERARRSADADRFRRGLGEISDAAEQALAAEQRTVRELDAELREARAMLEAKDAALGDLTGALDAAAATQAEAKSRARAEIDGLRERVAALETAGQEADRLRAEFEAARSEADGARAELDQTRSALNDVRNDAARLLSRLSSAHEAAADGA
jgi:golgin subfamily B member 1